MALPTKLQLQVVSAERSLVSEQVDEVVIPGLLGYFGVLPGHAPLLGVLGVGELSYRQGSLLRRMNSVVALRDRRQAADFLSSSGALRTWMGERPRPVLARMIDPKMG